MALGRGVSTEAVLTLFYFDDVTYFGDHTTTRNTPIKNAATKRALDCMLGLVFGLISLPIIIMLAPFIMRDGGPLFYGHTRITKGGKHFTCWKLRSMVSDADQCLHIYLAADNVAARQWQVSQKLINDPRITPIGRFMRRYRLDELPQFWNVLRGDLSLVGPRPVTEEELLRYGPTVSLYLQHRPGLTGPWQIAEQQNISYRDRVAIDADYLQDPSLMRDLLIIAKTPFAMLRRYGQ